MRTFDFRRGNVSWYWLMSCRSLVLSQKKSLRKVKILVNGSPGMTSVGHTTSVTTIIVRGLYRFVLTRPEHIQGNCRKIFTFIPAVPDCAAFSSLRWGCEPIIIELRPHIFGR